MSLWHENPEAAIAQRRRSESRRAWLAATARQLLALAIFLAVASGVFYGCVRIARLAWGAP